MVVNVDGRNYVRPTAEAVAIDFLPGGTAMGPPIGGVWFEHRDPPPLPGSPNDRWLIWVRYGQPMAWTQDRGDPYLRFGHEGTVSRTDPCMSVRVKEPVLISANLVINWSYRDLEFSFLRSPGRISADMISGEMGSLLDRVEEPAMVRFTPESRQLAEQLEAELPQFYLPRTITAERGYPHQLARFLGEAPDLIRLEVHGAPPLPGLRVAPGGSLDAGLFLHDDMWHEIWRNKQSVAVPDTALGMSYLVEVSPGQYHYTLEARETAPDSVPRPLGRTRHPVLAERFDRDRLSVSDLLLANDIIPRASNVTRRDQLQIEPSRTLRFRSGEPVHVYFEIYGLERDGQGGARYRLDVEVVELPPPGSPPGLLKRITGVLLDRFRRGERAPLDSSTGWERSVEAVAASDRVPDFFELRLPAARAAEYQVRITVTDLVGETTAETARGFRVTGDAG